MRRKERSVFWVNGYVEVRTLYIQSEYEVLCPDDGLEHPKIFVGRLVLDRSLVEVEEGIHDALFALARRRVNSRSGEEVFAPQSKVLIRRKGKTLLKLDLDSMFDPTKDLLGIEVLWLFPPCQVGLEIGRVKQTWHPRDHAPDSLSWKPEASTSCARV